MKIPNVHPENETPAQKLLLSFNDQFATNQNHHQSIFLQFLSAILVVLIGYGYVYINTYHYSLLFESSSTKDHLVYSAFHLVSTYIVAQFILTLLATVVLNIGYGFRRDQNVVQKIRKQFLGDKQYKEVFGEVSFSPKNQNFFDFLPEFNRMFFLGIAVLQVLLLVSLFFKLCLIIDYPKQSWCYWLYLFYTFPISWNIWLYCNYYKKYYWVMHDKQESLETIFMDSF